MDSTYPILETEHISPVTFFLRELESRQKRTLNRKCHTWTTTPLLFKTTGRGVPHPLLHDNELTCDLLGIEESVKDLTSKVLSTSSFHPSSSTQYRVYDV